MVSALPMNPFAPRITTFSVTAVYLSSSLGLPVTGKTGWAGKSIAIQAFTSLLEHPAPVSHYDALLPAILEKPRKVSMKPIVWSLLLTGVALNAVAQLLLKAATRYVGPLVSDSGRVDWVNATALWKAPPLWFGLGCYGVSVILWLGALSRLPVSVAYPMLSLGYVVNAVAAALLFGETFTAMKLAGIGLIGIGVILLSRAA